MTIFKKYSKVVPSNIRKAWLEQAVQALAALEQSASMKKQGHRVYARGGKRIVIQQ